MTTESTARALKHGLQERTGFPASRLVLSATHTHSGPAAALLSDDDEPWAVAYFKLLIDRLAQLIEAGRSRL